MYRPYQNINRRKSKSIKVGHVKIGDGSPISVQTMTNTITKDINSTLKQIERISIDRDEEIHLTKKYLSTNLE